MRILRDSYGIAAHEAPAERPAPPPKVSFRVLFAKPYRERTIVAGVMNICISFEYTAIAFFLPSILAQFLGAGVFETISASLGLNALFAFTGGLLGMHLAWKYPSRHVAIAGFALQFIALIVLALVGQPQATVGVVLAIAMLGLWLFAEGFGPGAQLMIYPALSYPTAIRATGVGFSRALSGIGSALALFVLPLLQASSARRCSGWCRWPPLFRSSSCLRFATSRRVTILTIATIKEQMMTLLSTGTDYEQLAAAFRPIFPALRRGRRTVNSTVFYPTSRFAG